MKIGEIEFHSNSYLSLDAVPPNDPDADPVASYMIKWDDAEQFSKSLRKAADFLDKHKDKCAFEVNID